MTALTTQCINTALVLKVSQAMPCAQAVSNQPLTETWVWSWTNLYEICGGQSGNGKGFSPSTSVFTCQYLSTIAQYSFIHLPPTLYNVFLPALQFSPVSIIPPLLNTHSFIYHPCCIMFFSQYFSFLLSVSFILEICFPSNITKFICNIYILHVRATCFDP
jgi:hypothetical protein